jgi:hypothetical protein
LGHVDGVAVGNGDDFVEILEFDDFRNEFVGDALDAVLPTLCPVESVGDSAGSTG